MSSPVVEFTDESGAVWKFQDQIWTMDSCYEVGERVEVIYNPSAPSSAMLADLHPYFVTVVFVDGSLVALGIGAAKL